MEEFLQPALVLIAIIVLARSATFLSRKLGLSAITIQLLIGILLGPSLFDLLGAPIILGTWGSPSSGSLHGVLKILAEIGLIQLMFLAGLQTDWQELRKTPEPIFFTTISTFVLTAVMVAIITRLFVDRWAEALGVSAIMASMSFGISVHNFNQMRFLGSHITNLILGSAVISGLFAILLMVAGLATSYAVTFGAFKATIAVSWFLGKLIMFFAISYFLTSRFLKLAERTGFQKRPLQMLMGYLLLVASLYAWAAMHFGNFTGVVVASLGGALLEMSKLEMKEKITKGFESVLASIPVGVLFMVLGMEVNLNKAGSFLFFFAVLFATVVVTRLVGSWIASRKVFESPREQILVMFGTLHQGEIGILIAAYLFSRGLLNPSSFNVAIIVVIVLTMITPMLMKIVTVRFNVQETLLQVAQPKKR
jgi:Kef-type K+ transport system membrane component KefB